MCGITGFVSFAGHRKEPAQRLVQAMLEQLSHRGPDGAGLYVDRNVALGHRRLAVIDLETGDQPISSDDGNLQLIFNGELYNYREIRRQLKARGCQFRTSSDTEVFLKSYQVWGKDFLVRMNGMFAFAIWNSQRSELLLGRDRLGKKPLYYYRDNDRLVFASELKSIRLIPKFKDKLSAQGLDAYLTLGFIPGETTIYQYVKKLLPAHTLLVSAESNSAHCYWQVDHQLNEKRSDDDVIAEFSELFDDAVLSRLVSDVPIGAFLSSGIDSSLVVSSMQRQLSSPVRTFTAGFDSDVSEAGPAKYVAEFLNTDHTELIVRSTATDVLEKIAWHFDEPIADSSALPTWQICEAARKHVTVILSGDGGDESFGGYTFRYLPHVYESSIRAAVPLFLRQLIFGPVSSIWPANKKLPKWFRLKTILSNLSTSDAQAFYDDLRSTSEDVRQRVYSDSFVESLRGFSPFEWVVDAYAQNGASDALSRIQIADTRVYLPDDVLVKVDRMSMAHALEVRSPLLDYRLVEFASTLTKQQKVRGRVGKMPLRMLAAKRLPESVLKVPKKGFSVPAADWFREELHDFAADRLFSTNGILAELLEKRALKSIWSEHGRGVRDHSGFLWAAMMLSLWEEQLPV